MTGLPRLMVAPNGARRTRADHPALPVTLPQIVDCALACHAAGADGLHAHVRDADGAHVLDAGLYAELLAELAARAPALTVQITTEAVGRYSPQDQRDLVCALRPAHVSIALREIDAEPDCAETRRFFSFCAEAGVGVQHILYDSGDVTRLAACVADGTIPGDGLMVLHVLGRYTPGQVSKPDDLLPFLARQKAEELAPDWAVCAFGAGETACLLAAARAGGKLRIGFENNLLQHDGTVAPDNAARLRDLLDRAAAENLRLR